MARLTERAVVLLTIAVLAPASTLVVQGMGAGSFSSSITYNFTGLALLSDPYNFSLAWMLLNYRGEVTSEYYLPYYYLYRGNNTTRVDEKALMHRLVRIIPDCSRNATSKNGVEVLYGSSGDTYIYIPVGPCKTFTPWPILVRINGTVTVRNTTSGIIEVNVTAKAKMPLLKEVYGKIELASLAGTSYGEETVKALVKGETITLKAVYVVMGRKVYQYTPSGTRFVGFTPFYIPYPVNVSQIEETREKKTIVAYNGFPLSFRLGETEVVTVTKGNITTRRVPVIIATLNHNQLIVQLEEATRKLLGPIESIAVEMQSPIYRGVELFAPTRSARHIEVVAELARDILENRNVTLSYKCCTISYIHSIYSVLTNLLSPPLEVYYWQHYPIEANIPVVFVSEENNETIGLVLKAWFNYPKALNTSTATMYPVGKKDTPLLLSLMAGIGTASAILLWYWKTRRRSSAKGSG